MPFVLVLCLSLLLAACGGGRLYAVRPAGNADPCTPDGVTRMAYDGASRTWTTTTPGGRILTAALDAEGRVVRSQLPGFPATDRVYDARSRLASATTGTRREGASLTRHGYDGRGHLTSAELPGGIRVDYDLDAYGRGSRHLPGAREPLPRRFDHGTEVASKPRKVAADARRPSRPLAHVLLGSLDATVRFDGGNHRMG